MKRIITIASMSVFLAACGGSGGGSGGDSNNAPGSEMTLVPELGAAMPTEPDVPVDTASLEVADDFAFATSRSIDIEFDLEQARGQEASVSLCTGYQPDGDAFDVDYETCTVQGVMIDGMFSHQMEVTNEFDSVMGVVWFQDASMEPLYREFHVDDATRMKNDGSMQRVIVWK